MRTVLRLTAVDAAYGEQEVLRRVDLELHEGRLACLVGPSGCGKSTLLRCVAGFEPVTAGRIELAGKVVSEPGRCVPPDQRRVGIVFQDYALFPHLRVRENVAFGLRGLRRDEAAAATRQLLETVDLAALSERYPHELSGGQQQRVALARALAPRPELLLLDEPFSNLDPDLSKRMLAELRRLLKTLGVTVVMVTHDQDEAFDVADVIGVMSQGSLQQWGEPSELYHRPVNRRVAEFLGAGAFLPARLENGAWRCDLGVLPPPATPPQSAGDVVVMLRPDDVRLEAETTGPAAPRATVLATSFRGTHIVYSLRLANGSEVYAFTDGRQRRRAIGETVTLQLSLAETVLLPSD